MPGGEGGILNRETFTDLKVWQMRVASWRVRNGNKGLSQVGEDPVVYATSKSFDFMS